VTMQTELETDIQLFAWIGAMLWSAYKLVRWQWVHPARFTDQVGLALWVLSLAMFCSRIGPIAF
jgi:hypothetical protein